MPVAHPPSASESFLGTPVYSSRSLHPQPSLIAMLSPLLLYIGAPLAASSHMSVICSRLHSSIKHRDTTGAHTGSYSVYRAMPVTLGDPNPLTQAGLRQRPAARRLLVQPHLGLPLQDCLIRPVDPSRAQ